MNIYRHYTRRQLDAEYDNRAKVSDFDSHVQLWDNESAAARSEPGAELDVAYGDSARQKLDVFRADQPNAPIHFFIHGGYWRSMSKNEFSYVARALRAYGAATVVMDYDLMPDVSMTELVRQCRAALAWVHRHAGDFGADRNRLFVSGHSAGGHLTAMMCATQWPEFDSELPADAVKGATSISGLMDLEPIRLCYLNDTLDLSEQDVVSNSPVSLPRGTVCPLNVCVGGKEGDEYLRQSETLVKHWSDQSPAPELIVLDGDDHFSIVSQLNDPQSRMSRIIARQMGVA